MNELTPPHNLEWWESKCPVSKRIGFIKDILDRIVPRRKNLRYLESLANKSLLKLEKLDFKLAIVSIWICPNWHELAYFFDMIINRTLNLEEWNTLDRIISIALIEIYSLVILHKRYWLDKWELLSLVEKSMEGIIAKEVEGKVRQIWIQYLIYETVFKKNLDKHEIIPYIRGYFEEHQQRKRKCPYWDSSEKMIFINWVWEILEHKFLPALQDTYKDREELSEEELFYLGNLWYENENLDTLSVSENDEKVLREELDKAIEYLSGINMTEFLKWYKKQNELKLGSGFISRIVYEMLNSFIFEGVDNLSWEERKKIMSKRGHVFSVLHNFLVSDIGDYFNQNQDTKSKTGDEIWKIVENNLIPALESIFWDKKDLQDTELAYLKRYN